MMRTEILALRGIGVDRAAGPPQLVQDQYERCELERSRAVLSKTRNA